MRSSKIAGICVIAVAVGLFAFGCRAPRKIAVNKQAATLSSPHSVTLTWHASPEANFYCVYRSTVSKSGYQKIGTSPTPNFKDAPVPSGATFYYVVTAVSDKGESKYSSEIKAVVP